MSRTTVEVSLRAGNVDGVLETIAGVLEPNKYRRNIVDGEEVWSKGDGVLTVMQCVSATFTGSSVVIQGWIKDAMTGESALEGFVAGLPKKKLKKQIESICDTIRAKGL